MLTARSALLVPIFHLLLTVRAPAQSAVRVAKGEMVEVAVVAPGTAREERSLRAGSLPFTAADAIHYFSTALEMSSERAPGGVTVFENQHDPQPEDRWRIGVQTEDRSITVEFTVGGNYGMGLAREFFESPLFERGESEHFYEMLGRAQKGPLDRMRRFTVEMTLRDTRQTQILTLRFIPRDE